MTESIESKTIERHPLQPFLPLHGRILFLGSFPPPHKRWSMEFFYPNIQNDMWRIFGLIFFNDKNYFYNNELKRFDKQKIEETLNQLGIGVFDTATAVHRLRGNASDQFLEIIEPTDISQLLQQMPNCHAIVATGGKAAEEVRLQAKTSLPKVGEWEWSEALNVKFYRMPSSSRSYPLALTKKAAAYRSMFIQEGIKVPFDMS